MLHFLDIVFFIFHTTLIAFILFAWIWRPLRKPHLILCALTALSWFGLGIFFGFGYCPCTDWHWEVRRQLGDHDLPYSYITFLIQRTTGWRPSDTAVNIVTVSAFFLVFALGAFLLLRQRREPIESDSGE